MSEYASSKRCWGAFIFVTGLNPLKEITSVEVPPPSIRRTAGNQNPYAIVKTYVPTNMHVDLYIRELQGYLA